MGYHGVKLERKDDADQMVEVVVCVGGGDFAGGLELLFSDGFWDVLFGG
jgi:hypothetical protein